MNIFYVDSCPAEAAISLVDKHVVKMILESAQLLSTAHRILDGNCVEVTLCNPDTGKFRKKKVWVLHDARNDIMYNATHMNHPSAIWCRESVENYNWLGDHLFALCNEYTYRYGKVHKVQATGLMLELLSPPFNLKTYDHTPMRIAMSDEFKISDDPVINYRNYYRQGKQHLHKWTKRQAPDWIQDTAP